MKNLVIIGAGRFGREVHSWARQARDFGVVWRIKGFLDSRPKILDGFRIETPVLAAPEDYFPVADDVFVCAVGDPAAKQRYCAMLAARRAEFTNVIHSTVVLAEDVKLGRGIVLCPFVIVSDHVVIGDFVTVNMQSFLAHDVQVGDYTQVHGHVSINGGVRLGMSCVVGSNAAILPDMVIGDNATVGIGSVVLQPVPAGQTVFGNPARRLGLSSTHGNAPG